MEKREKLEQEEKDQSTRPENWPGIPARSADSDVEEDAAQVTQAQRELEREVERGEPSEEPARKASSESPDEEVRRS